MLYHASLTATRQSALYAACVELQSFSSDEIDELESTSGRGRILKKWTASSGAKSKKGKNKKGPSSELALTLETCNRCLDIAVSPKNESKAELEKLMARATAAGFKDVAEDVEDFLKEVDTTGKTSRAGALRHNMEAGASLVVCTGVAPVAPKAGGADASFTHKQCCGALEADLEAIAARAGAGAAVPPVLNFPVSAFSADLTDLPGIPVVMFGPAPYVVSSQQWLARVGATANVITDIECDKDFGVVNATSGLPVNPAATCPCLQSYCRPTTLSNSPGLITALQAAGEVVKQQVMAGQIAPTDAAAQQAATAAAFQKFVAEKTFAGKEEFPAFFWTFVATDPKNLAQVGIPEPFATQFAAAYAALPLPSPQDFQLSYPGKRLFYMAPSATGLPDMAKLGEKLGELTAHFYSADAASRGFWDWLSKDQTVYNLAMTVEKVRKSRRGLKKGERTSFQRLQALFGADWTAAHTKLMNAGDLFAVDMSIFEKVKPASAPGVDWWCPATVVLLARQEDAASGAVSLLPVAVRVSGFEGKDVQVYHRALKDEAASCEEGDPNFCDSECCTRSQRCTEKPDAPGKFQCTEKRSRKRRPVPAAPEDATDSAWIMALLAARASLSTFGIGLAHIGGYHLSSGAVTGAMINAVAATGVDADSFPIKRIVDLHHRFGIQFNSILLASFEQLFPPLVFKHDRTEFLRATNEFFKQRGRSWAALSPVGVLRNNGLRAEDFTSRGGQDWDAFPLMAEDLRVWDFSEQYVAGFLKATRFRKSGVVRRDPTLKHWEAALLDPARGNLADLTTARRGRGGRQLGSKKQLTELLTHLVYQVASHGASRMEAQIQHNTIWIGQMLPHLTGSQPLKGPAGEYTMAEIMARMPRLSVVGSLTRFFQVFAQNKPYDSVFPTGNPEVDRQGWFEGLPEAAGEAGAEFSDALFEYITVDAFGKPRMYGALPLIKGVHPEFEAQVKQLPLNVEL